MPKKKKPYDFTNDILNAMSEDVRPFYKNKPISHTCKREIIELYWIGFHINDLSKVFEVSTKEIREWLKRG